MIDLYQANEKLCAVIALDLGISHGMVFLCLTKIDDYPNRLLSEFVSKADKVNWLVNGSAVINIDAGLDQLHPKGAHDIYNTVIGGMDCNEVKKKTNHELCGLMILCKKHETCIRSKILEEPKSNSPKFDWLCNVIVSGIQRLTRNGIKGRHSSLNNVGTYSVEWAEIARNSEDIVPDVGV